MRLTLQILHGRQTWIGNLQHHNLLLLHNLVARAIFANSSWALCWRISLEILVSANVHHQSNHIETPVSKLAFPRTARTRRGSPILESQHSFPFPDATLQPKIRHPFLSHPWPLSHLQQCHLVCALRVIALSRCSSTTRTTRACAHRAVHPWEPDDVVVSEETGSVYNYYMLASGSESVLKIKLARHRVLFSISVTSLCR